MTRAPFYGVALAALGTLILTPDSLFMRLSEMNGLQMAAWRGLLMGGVMIGLWALLSGNRTHDLQFLKTRSGWTIVMCQFFNTLLFCLGIAIAPVAVVLLGLAAVPVFAALLAWLIMGERTHIATWIAIGLVLLGIGIAVSGGGGAHPGGIGLDTLSLLGALFGLGTAAALALNFVVLRAHRELPIMLLIGCGALVAGVLSVVLIGPQAMDEGKIWAMMATGAVVLPTSFFMLSLASRHTHASNVSLLMLLETVLGPLWVWLVIGEAPTSRMMVGGAIVVISLSVYLLIIPGQGRKTSA